MNRNGKNSEWVGAALGLALQAIIFIPYFFGLGFTFYRFGSSQGIIAIVAPPFAWYRGISYFWVEPKWQEDWNMKSGTLAFLLMNTGSDDPRVTLEFRQYEGNIKKWISKIPNEERQSLEIKSKAFGIAVFEYQKEMMHQLIESSEPKDIWKTPSIQKQVMIFSSDEGFMEIWKKMKSDYKFAMQMIQQQFDEMDSDSNSEKVKERMTDFMEQQGSILLAQSKEKIENKINFLFENK